MWVEGFTRCVQVLQGDPRASSTPLPLPPAASRGAFGWDKAHGASRQCRCGTPGAAGTPQSGCRNAPWREEPAWSRARGAAKITGSPIAPPKPSPSPTRPSSAPRLGLESHGRGPGRGPGAQRQSRRRGRGQEGGGCGRQHNCRHRHRLGGDGPEGNINPPTRLRQPGPRHRGRRNRSKLEPRCLSGGSPTQGGPEAG